MKQCFKAHVERCKSMRSMRRVSRSPCISGEDRLTWQSPQRTCGYGRCSGQGPLSYVRLGHRPLKRLTVERLHRHQPHIQRPEERPFAPADSHPQRFARFRGAVYPHHELHFRGPEGGTVGLLGSERSSDSSLHGSRACRSTYAEWQAKMPSSGSRLLTSPAGITIGWTTARSFFKP